ncbi:hypothetical protein DYU05_03115 [Mucilaginibacter terrenus]|uniref:DUF1795 domain-containing protein n=1 Tax=Mucilaginibacter terrenus TaxID=2482727 RepID=A0A3E2NUH3_9SPHI|nr:hypothetical protein [Mucilaginibacter terrenus]RFZ84619.1 hypothetical protein DYU05_03115 [Mucilaginibacter terrenus]
MKKSQLVFLAAGLLFFAACKGSGSSADKKDSLSTSESQTKPVNGAADTNVVSTTQYQITKPEGWKKSERTAGKFTLLIIAGPKDGDFSPNMNVLADDMKGKTMAEYIDFNLKQMEAMKIQNLKTEDIEAAGLKGKKLTYSYQYGGRDIAINSYILPKDNTAYVLTASSLTSQVGKYQPLFESAVQSFKLL